MRDHINFLEQILKDLKDSKKSKKIIKRLIELWDDDFYSVHYRSVAEHQNSYHHKEMLDILEEAEEFLLGDE